jgi:hypothetical protein
MKKQQFKSFVKEIIKEVISDMGETARVPSNLKTPDEKINWRADASFPTPGENMWVDFKATIEQEPEYQKALNAVAKDKGDPLPFPDIDASPEDKFTNTPYRGPAIDIDTGDEWSDENDDDAAEVEKEKLRKLAESKKSNKK